MIDDTDTSAVSFSDFVESAFSGAHVLGDVPESPAEPSSDSAAGAPPAEPAPAQTDTTANPSSDATTVEPPQTLEKAPADATAPSAATDPDPLANSTPLTYTVNGQERTYDGIKVIPGVGAVIEAANLNDLQRRLTERDSLFERSQQTYQQVQDLERLMTWTQTVNGQEETLSGPQAIESMRVALGRSLALNDTLTKALEDPDTFASLVGVDANNGIMLNPAALKLLAAESQLAQVNAERMVRSHWQTLAAPQTPKASAPSIEQSAPTIAAHFAQQFGQGVLTKTDTDFLATQVGRYVRPATMTDVQADPTMKVGDPVVDAAFNALVQDRAELRKQAAAQVSQAGVVAKENAAKLAAALPQAKPAATPNTNQRQVQQQQQKAQEQQGKHDLFSMQERAAMGIW